MTAALHARSYGRFIKIKSKLRRKKLDRTSQCSNFLEAVLAKLED